MELEYVYIYMYLFISDEQRLISRYAEQTSHQNWLINVSFYLQTTINDAKRQVAGGGPQQDSFLREFIYYIFK